MHVFRFGAGTARGRLCVFAPAIARLSVALTAGTTPSGEGSGAPPSGSPPGDDAFQPMRWDGAGTCVTVEQESTDVRLWLRRPVTTQRAGAWPLLVTTRPPPAP